MIYLFFYTVVLVSVSMAAGASFIGDIFFLISARQRHISLREIVTLQRLNTISLISSIVAGVSEIILLSFRIETGLVYNEGFTFSVALMLLVAFTCALTLRNIHLPALKRHHHDYRHLSDSFIIHHDSLIATSAVSSLTWLFIIILVGADNQSVSLGMNAALFTVIYVLCAYIASKASIFVKKILKR